MKTLHITNGDSAVTVMRAAGVTGEILPWRDVLHEGPVPGGLSMQSLSSRRVAFISAMGWGESQEVQHSFDQRDSLLAASHTFDRIVLWFEQDLYDQLQLLQLMDWFSNQSEIQSRIFLIQAQDYLGTMSPEQLATLIGTESTVTRNQFQLASQAWNAFTGSDPGEWANLMKVDLRELPYLKDAVLRMLEEYPSSINGLSRTQSQALLAIEAGESRPGHVFGMSQDMEQYRFMGDSTFWFYLNQMLQSDPPLLVLPVGNSIHLPVDGSELLTLTREGLEVVHALLNWLDIHEIDRWIGGVHLTPENTWCWDSANQILVKHLLVKY